MPRWKHYVGPGKIFNISKDLFIASFSVVSSSLIANMIRNKVIRNIALDYSTFEVIVES